MHAGSETKRGDWTVAENKMQKMTHTHVSWTSSSLQGRGIKLVSLLYTLVTQSEQGNEFITTKHLEQAASQDLLHWAAQHHFKTNS